MQTPSFFDYAMTDQGGPRSRAFLDEMKQQIPYERLETLLIDAGVYRPHRKGQGGRPPYRSSVLLGALFLQAWYGLSDPMTEELIHDRLSFRHFLEIRSDDDIPDETTLCKFRNALMDAMLFDTIFEEITALMQERGLILKEGSHVDATLIHSSEPKRKRDREGNIITNQAADSDATYTSKRGQKHHGFKLHINADRNGMIKKATTTTAKDSDINQLEYLIEEETEYVTADSAYMSKANKRKLRHKGIVNGIIERRVRGQSHLRKKQRRHNKRFAAVRAIVELPFAFIKHHMHYTTTRFTGLEKNDQYHFLLATAYNLRRAPGVERKLSYG